MNIYIYMYVYVFHCDVPYSSHLLRLGFCDCGCVCVCVKVIVDANEQKCLIYLTVMLLWRTYHTKLFLAKYVYTHNRTLSSESDDKRHFLQKQCIYPPNIHGTGDVNVPIYIYMYRSAKRTQKNIHKKILIEFYEL